MFMTNIPRRKIYEEMLVFEDGMIDLQILTYNEDNFKRFENNFNTKSLPEIKKAYNAIKALMVLFLQNKKFESEEEYNTELQRLINNMEEVNETIMLDANIRSKMKKQIAKLDLELERFDKVNSVEDSIYLFEELDILNSIIPKFLEIRRDHMK